MTVYILIAGIVVCIIGSAFFSASEMSFSSANHIRLENMMDEGDEQAKRAVKITDNFDVALSTILVGNNLVNIVASSLASLLVILVWSEDYAGLATMILTILVIIFGETIPKITAKKNATRYALRFSGMISFLTVILRPVTWVVVFLTDLITSGMKGEETDDDAVVEELHSIIDTAEDEKVLDEDSTELINNAIDFADIMVGEVMTARVDILAVNVEDSPQEIMDTIISCGFSRLPVYEDSIDNVIGVLSVNHYLKAALDDPDVDIRGLLMDPVFVYKTVKLPSALSTLRSTQLHLAVVTDEYGGTLGVVTMEDILEEIVGEIWDETDQVEEDITVVEDGVFLVEGDTVTSELMELMDWDELQFDFESETLGGWCIEMTGHFPKVGETFDYRNLHVTILDCDERRVNKIKVEVQKEE